MGLRGPTAKPNALKLIQGNPGRRPLITLTDSVDPLVEIPDCPEYLTEEAAAEWHRITPELFSLGLISQMDMANLAMYCQSFGRWVQVESKLKSAGIDGLVDESETGVKKMSALLRIANLAMEQVNRYASEFGMSPAQRSRVKPSSRLQLDLMDLENNEENVQKPTGTSRFFPR